MNKIKKILRKLSKNIVFTVLLMLTVAVSIYTIAWAVESDDFSNDSTDSTAQAEAAETQLTTEEIDKIIEDLKISGNIDNILEKLDEIIQRAQLSGNTALQEYASNMKTSYQLQKELDSVNSLIGAMKKKNSSIAQVDEQVTKILSVNTIIEDLRGAVSNETLLVLESLSDENVKLLQELMAEIEHLYDMNDVALLSVQQRSVLDVLVLNEIISKSMVGGERLELAKQSLSVAVTILESYQKQNYSEADYKALNEGSDAFLKKGRKASMALPEQVVFMDGYFNMKHAPIMYDGHILLAIDDLYQYVDAKIEYMYNNATMVIQSPGKTLEIVSGKNVAYLNDEPKNMPVPVLNYNDTIYMSAEFFAQAYDISYRYLTDHECLIMYKNLVQIGNPSIPNQLNKD